MHAWLWLPAALLLGLGLAASFRSAQPMHLKTTIGWTGAGCPPVHRHYHHSSPFRLRQAPALEHNAGALATITDAEVTNKPSLTRGRPYTICHRGLSGEFPEHTFLSYIGGIAAGGDYIECDVVLTKDLVPICRHEPLLSNTTNADELFPELIRTYVIDGVSYTGVFSVDLCFAQIQKLRARQPWPNRSGAWDDYVGVPTLRQYLHYALHADRAVGVYPETKHPTWHDALPQLKAAGTTITDIVLREVEAAGYTGPLNSPEWLARPIFLQSFEVNNLKYASKRTSIPIIQLVDGNMSLPVPDSSGKTFGDLLSPAGLQELSTYAQGIGVDKSSLHDAQLQPTDLANRAHDAGLQVHLYTLRVDQPYHNLSAHQEYELFFKKQPVDGAFTDFGNDLRAWIDEQTAAGYDWPDLLT